MTRETELHRREFERFVLDDAEPSYRRPLSRLYANWHRINADYFDAALVVPYVLLAQPSQPKRYGQFAPVSSFGGHAEIRIRPSLLDGTHPHMVLGGSHEGRFRFVADILLHEIIHQAQHEVLGAAEESYHGHGTVFRDTANRIGTELGLPPVRTNKKRGADRDRPSCSQWPHCVRPDDYYLGAYWPSTQPSPPAAAGTDLKARAEQIAQGLTCAEIRELANLLICRAGAANG